MALPSFFISHGSPDIVLQPSDARDYLASLFCLWRKVVTIPKSRLSTRQSRWASLLIILTVLLDIDFSI